MALLVVRRRGERRDAHVAVVELGGEALDRAALAGRVPALEQHAHGRPEAAVADQPAQLKAQRAQALLRRRQAVVLLLAPQLEAQVDLVETPHQAARGAGLPSASSTVASSMSTPSATPGWVILPPATFTPARRPGSMVTASPTPLSASSST